MKDEQKYEQTNEQRKTRKTAHKRATPHRNDNSALYLVMIGMVCLLLVLSVVQTMQINALKAKTGTTGTVNTPTSAGRTTGQPAPKASPQMVGGC